MSEQEEMGELSYRDVVVFCDDREYWLSNDYALICHECHTDQHHGSTSAWVSRDDYDALEARNRELEAARARLAAALNELAHHGTRCDLNPTVANWDALQLYNALTGLVRAGDRHVRDIAAAALTADDAKLAEKWRAMEKVCDAAQRAYERYKNERDAHEGFPRGECAWAMGVDLEEPLVKLAAVRAVEETK